MNRRKYLAAVASAAAIAGCSGGDEPTDGEDNQPTQNDSSGSTAGGDSSSNPTDTQSPTPSRTEEAVVGQVVASQQLSMVVRGTSTTNQLSQFQTAESGNTFLVIDLAVKNRTESEFANFSSFLQTTLTDGESYSYDPSISTGEGSFQGGQLAPGEVARGTIPFEVPEDAGDFELQFDFSSFSFTNINRVFIDLSESASQIGDVEQTLQVPINSVGDTVERQNTAVTINSVDFTSQVGGQYGTQADSGNEFAIADISVSNNTDQDLNISPSIQMTMKDSTGAGYSSSLVATSQLDQSFDVSSAIASGRSRRGKIAFEVPQSANTLYTTFEFSLFATGDKAFWQVK